MFDNWVKASILFYNFMGGIGLFLAGLGGLKVLHDWALDHIEKNRVRSEKNRVKSEKNRVKIITEKLKQKYPFKDFKKTFELIRAKNYKAIYILDKKGKFKIWVDSPQRLHDLGFKFGDERITTKAEVDSYEEKKIFYK